MSASASFSEASSAIDDSTAFSTLVFAAEALAQARAVLVTDGDLGGIVDVAAERAAVRAYPGGHGRQLAQAAQQACVEALKDAAFVKRTIALNDKERAVLARALGDLGFGVGDSATNFVFARSPIPGRELFKALLRLGVIIRPLDEYGMTQHVRISVGTPAQNKALLKALGKVLSRVPVAA